jgi:hypothetical protein
MNTSCLAQDMGPQAARKRQGGRQVGDCGDHDHGARYHGARSASAPPAIDEVLIARVPLSGLLNARLPLARLKLPSLTLRRART